MRAPLDRFQETRVFFYTFVATALTIVEVGCATLNNNNGTGLPRMEAKRFLEKKLTEEWTLVLRNQDFRVIQFNGGIPVPIGSILISTNDQFAKARTNCFIPPKVLPRPTTNNSPILFTENKNFGADLSVSELAGAAGVPISGGFGFSGRKAIWVKSDPIRQIELSRDDLIDGILNDKCVKEVLSKKDQTLFAVGGHLFVSNSIVVGKSRQLEAFVGALLLGNAGIYSGSSGVAYGHSPNDGTCYLLVTSVPQNRFQEYQDAKDKADAKAAARAKARLLKKPKR